MEAHPHPSRQSKPYLSHEDRHGVQEARPNGVVQLKSRAHDISFTNYHIAGMKTLGSELTDAITAVWPARHDSRYQNVHVLFLSWQDDDLGVSGEIKQLRHVFKDRFHFQVEDYLIPSVNPLILLTKRVLKFMELDSLDTLLIVYYGGHASQPTEPNGTPSWAANRNNKNAKLPSATIQSLLEEVNGDVLMLLDCCHSAAIPTTGSFRIGRGVFEVIAACGYETIAAEVDEHSFTKSLTEVLALMSKGSPFSIGELHSRVLTKLKCWAPGLISDSQGKFLDALDGQLMKERQPRRTPVYSIIGESSPRRSIVIRPLVQLKHPQVPISEEGNFKPQTGDVHHLAARKRKRSLERDKPCAQVLLAVRLHGEDLDMPSWVEWIRNCPIEAKDIHIEGKWGSFSTLVLLRMPVAVWNLLPDNKAYTFVGFVTSSNTVFRSCCSPGLRCPCEDACSTCNAKQESTDVLSDIELKIGRLDTGDGAAFSPIRDVDQTRSPAQLHRSMAHMKAYVSAPDNNHSEQTYDSVPDIVMRATSSLGPETLLHNSSVTLAEPKSVSQPQSHSLALTPGFPPQPEFLHRQSISQDPSNSSKSKESLPQASGAILVGTAKAIPNSTDDLFGSAAQVINPRTQSFKIRSEKSHSQQIYTPELVEDSISSYDLTPETLKIWLEKRFPGYTFEGDKIKSKFDRLIFWAPEYLTSEERKEIDEGRGVAELPAPSLTTMQLNDIPNASDCASTSESLNSHHESSTLASASAFDAAGISRPQTQASSTTSNNGAQRPVNSSETIVIRWLWSCDNCGRTSAMDTETTLTCPECGHWRCATCPCERLEKNNRNKNKKKRRSNEKS